MSDKGDKGALLILGKYLLYFKEFIIITFRRVNLVVELYK
jgi:hypothetical protein